MHCSCQTWDQNGFSLSGSLDGRKNWAKKLCFKAKCSCVFCVTFAMWIVIIVSVHYVSLNRFHLVNMKSKNHQYFTENILIYWLIVPIILSGSLKTSSPQSKTKSFANPNDPHNNNRPESFCQKLKTKTKALENYKDVAIWWKKRIPLCYDSGWIWSRTMALFLQTRATQGDPQCQMCVIECQSWRSSERGMQAHWLYTLLFSICGWISNAKRKWLRAVM